jgi:hypothetical protein
MTDTRAEFIHDPEGVIIFEEPTKVTIRTKGASSKATVKVLPFTREARRKDSEDFAVFWAGYDSYHIPQDAEFTIIEDVEGALNGTKERTESSDTSNGREHPAEQPNSGAVSHGKAAKILQDANPLVQDAVFKIAWPEREINGLSRADVVTEAAANLNTEKRVVLSTGGLDALLREYGEEFADFADESYSEVVATIVDVATQKIRRESNGAVGKAFHAAVYDEIAREYSVSDDALDILKEDAKQEFEEQLPDDFRYEVVWHEKDGWTLVVETGCPNCGYDGIFNGTLALQNQWVGRGEEDGKMSCTVDDCSPELRFLACGACSEVLIDNGDSE